MSRRTTFITAAAVGGALFVGTGAIAANIGVLNAADDDSIGNLSADAPVETPAASVEPQVLDVYVEDPPVTEASVAPTTAAEAPPALAQQFAVDAAGAVTVEQTPKGLFVKDVQANEGWEWSTGQSSSSELTVTFVSGDSTFEFYATVGADGQIEARVDQPIINVVEVPSRSPSPAASSSASPAPSAGTSGSGGSYEDEDDHDEDDHDEDESDHEDDHHEAEEEHYEGGEDDD